MFNRLIVTIWFVILAGCAGIPDNQNPNASSVGCVATSGDQAALLQAAMASEEIQKIITLVSVTEQQVCARSTQLDPAPSLRSFLVQLEEFPEDYRQALLGRNVPQHRGLIGVHLNVEEGGMRIVSVLEGGPAWHSGVRAGDLILGVSTDAEAAPAPVAGKSMSDVIGLIGGEPDTDVALMVLPESSMDTQRVRIKRAEISQERFAEQRQREQLQGLVRRDNRGEYLSPYTQDGVVAEWVNRAINANMGAAAGSAVGAAAGSYAANRALNNVPGGRLVGGMFGSRAGAAVGRDQAIAHSGGEALMRQSSDLSFDSLQNMAAWLKHEHGQSANFAEVVQAANHVYPGLVEAVAASR